MPALGPLFLCAADFLMLVGHGNRFKDKLRQYLGLLRVHVLMQHILGPQSSPYFGTVGQSIVICSHGPLKCCFTSDSKLCARPSQRGSLRLAELRIGKSFWGLGFGVQGFGLEHKRLELGFSAWQSLLRTEFWGVWVTVKGFGV